MHNNKKNNDEKNLIKYFISLLVVAMIFIAIGGISLSRSINRGDERITKNFNTNDKVQQVSEENLKLTRENRSLRLEIEEAKKSYEALKLQKHEADKKIRAYELYFQAQEVKDEDPEKYRKTIKKIKSLGIDEELKEKLTKQQQEGE